ncbi:hypothetical protein, partial [Nostoc sp.]
INTVQLRIIVGWVERSETQQTRENVGFRLYLECSREIEASVTSAWKGYGIHISLKKRQSPQE